MLRSESVAQVLFNKINETMSVPFDARTLEECSIELYVGFYTIVFVKLPTVCGNLHMKSSDIYNVKLKRSFVHPMIHPRCPMIDLSEDQTINIFENKCIFNSQQLRTLMNARLEHSKFRRNGDGNAAVDSADVSHSQREFTQKPIYRWSIKHSGISSTLDSSLENIFTSNIRKTGIDVTCCDLTCKNPPSGDDLSHCWLSVVLPLNSPTLQLALRVVPANTILASYRKINDSQSPVRGDSVANKGVQASDDAASLRTKNDIIDQRADSGQQHHRAKERAVIQNTGSMERGKCHEESRKRLVCNSTQLDATSTVSEAKPFLSDDENS
ncbi:hypothetical protein WN51_13003 [Melipona quadrifasciata]|uniref:Uncharacterized protein n=1 Tax=Melipona quadrifasciata TaxID=166423 RepID=A0A0M9ACU1_9HYME|nr:hypothetical protein WN51_13003 [Melipona quadrifasciata]